jgi:hypothetical protein
MTAKLLGFDCRPGVPTACPVVAAAPKKVQGNGKIFVPAVGARQIGGDG